MEIIEKKKNGQSLEKKTHPEKTFGCTYQSNTPQQSLFYK